MEQRLLDASLLPPTLWDSASQTLILPSSLSQAYAALIDRYNLRSLAASRSSDDPPEGGISQERTDQHLAQAFSGSVARAQLAFLDPKSDIVATSNAYLGTLAGNRVTIVDAPCGAGAAAFSFLSSVAELRAREVLPREPLDVTLIGAELSDPARKYAEEIFLGIQPFLEEQGIFVKVDFVSWNVTNALSNTQLIKKMVVSSSTNPNQLLIVANFNSFLVRSGKRGEAEPQLTELFRHASGPKSVALWIEPYMNRAISPGGILPWLRQKISTAWREFAREKSPIGEPIPMSSALFRLPLNSSETSWARLAVIPIDLRYPNE